MKQFYSKLHKISIKQNELDISFIPTCLLVKCNTKWFSTLRPVWAERRKENNWKPKNKNKNKNNENKKVSKQTSEAKQITENQQKPDKLIISPGSPALHRPSPVFPIVWLNYIIYRVYLTFKFLFWIPIWSLWVPLGNYMDPLVLYNKCYILVSQFSSYFNSKFRHTSRFKPFRKRFPCEISIIVKFFTYELLRSILPMSYYIVPRVSLEMDWQPYSWLKCRTAIKT